MWIRRASNCVRCVDAAHELVTAVVCHQDRRPVWHDVATPRLVMRDFSEEFLEGYLAAEGGAVTGTVGAYRLESRGVQLFDSIEGDYSAILGLPLLPLLSFLRRVCLLVA